MMIVVMQLSSENLKNAVVSVRECLGVHSLSLPGLVLPLSLVYKLLIKDIFIVIWNSLL